MCPRFVSCCRSRSRTSRLREAFLATCGEGERELALSGRPRRAKGRPKPGRGGQVTGSASASEGHPQGCRGSGESNRWKASRVAEASPRSRVGWGKRSWPSRRHGCESRRGEPARRRGRQRWVARIKRATPTEPVVAGNTHRGRPGRTTEALGRRENAQAPESRAQAR